MAETAIELGYDAIVDGDVVDGRELASELIVDAWRLLIPYAKECPACAGQMLAALMGEVIPKAEAEWKRLGKAPSLQFWKAGAAERPEELEAHIKRTEAFTRRLLKVKDGHKH